MASAECPSDDEDLEECEPGTGESARQTHVDRANGVSSLERAMPRSQVCIKHLTQASVGNWELKLGTSLFPPTSFSHR